MIVQTQDELPKEIEKQKNQRAEYRLWLRKKELNEIIKEKRNLNSSNQAQLPLQLEEVKEEPLKPEDGKLQLNQYKRFHYPRKKGKTCWKCKAWGHFKRNCPQMKCYYCGCQGLTKKRCFKRDLHLGIQTLKKKKRTKNKKKKIQRRKTKPLMIVVKKWNSGKKEKDG